MCRRHLLVFTCLALSAIILTACGQRDTASDPSAESSLKSAVSRVATSEKSDSSSGLNEKMIQDLFKAKRFKQLEQMAAKLREEKTLNDDGDWLLGIFYDYLTGPYYKRESEQKFLALCEEWREISPGSDVFHMTLARAYTDFAWRERGADYAYKVGAHQWERFFDYLKLAWKELEAVDTSNAYVPEAYPLRLKVALGIGHDPSSSGISRTFESVKALVTGQYDPNAYLEEIFEEAVEVEPLYYHTYIRRAMTLLPQWGGAPGEMEKLAAESADRTKDAIGEALYARIAFFALSMQLTGRYQLEFDFDWSRVRQGFRDLEEQFPNSKNWPHAFARIACAHEDKMIAAEKFKEIGDDFRKSAWHNRMQFRMWRKWALEDGHYPVYAPLERPFRYDDAKEFRRVAQSADVDIDMIRERGTTFLIDAVLSNELPMIRTLLDLGADPNVPAPDGWDALNCAINYSSPRSLELLLEHGADPESLSPKGDIPLKRAIYYDKHGHAEVLVKHGADVNATNKKGWPSLHAACRDGDVEAVKLLLELGADINFQMEDNSWTPLHVAVKKARMNIVEYLLEQGADTTLRLDSGRSPLNLAVKDGQDHIADIIRNYREKQKPESK